MRAGARREAIAASHRPGSESAWNWSRSAAGGVGGAALCPRAADEIAVVDVYPEADEAQAADPADELRTLTPKPDPPP